MPEISSHHIELTIETSEDERRKGIVPEFVAYAALARCRTLCKPAQDPDAECAASTFVDPDTGLAILTCAGLTGQNGCYSSIVEDFGRTRSPVTIAAEWVCEQANGIGSRLA